MELQTLLIIPFRCAVEISLIFSIALAKLDTKSRGFLLYLLTILSVDPPFKSVFDRIEEVPSFGSNS